MSDQAAERDVIEIVRLEASTARHIAEVCRAFAARCMESDVTRVLIKISDDDWRGALAFVDAFRMIVLTGIPKGLKTAVVAGTIGVEETYSKLQPQLQADGIDVKIFTREQHAMRWLQER
jgi:hypothetical protein